MTWRTPDEILGGALDRKREGFPYICLGCSAGTDELGIGDHAPTCVRGPYTLAEVAAAIFGGRYDDMPVAEFRALLERVGVES